MRGYVVMVVLLVMYVLASCANTARQQTWLPQKKHKQKAHHHKK